MKIVVLDGYAENPGDLSWGGLGRLGDPAVYDRTPTDRIAKRIGDAEAVYTNKAPISAQLIKRCPNLKFIRVLATDYNVIDTATAKATGMIVSNIPTYGTDAVIQYAIALLLGLCHHIGEHSDCVKAGGWTHNADWYFWKHPLAELAGKMFGVVGPGGIERGTAKIVEALGIEMLAYSKYPNKALETDNCRYASLDELLAQADIIGLHCPLFPPTEGIINKDSTARMKDGVKIINTSRGPLVVEKDLREALDSGKVSGAAVDMVSIEPTHEDNPPLGVRNMTITPHVTWAPEESRQRLMNIAVGDLKHFVDGAPQNVVNK